MTVKQGGFTLIELVVVITILGILAAFAIPRFASLESEARSATVEALGGSVRSGAALAHALHLAQGQITPITMEGASIVIADGYPDLDTIDDTLSSLDGFEYDGAGLFSKEDGAGDPITDCDVTYVAPANPGEAPSITVETDGC